MLHTLRSGMFNIFQRSIALCLMCPVYLLHCFDRPFTPYFLSAIRSKTALLRRDPNPDVSPCLAGIGKGNQNDRLPAFSYGSYPK